jgi:MFS family permease
MNLGKKNAEDTCLTNHPDNAVTISLESQPIPDNSTGNHEDISTFPEGGIKAWSVVLGSFCAMFSVFGMINTTAVFQQYLSTHQLRQYSPSQIGWIFSLCLFLTFFGGAFIGPVFDAHGPRVLVLCGSLLLGSSMLLIGLCTGEFQLRNESSNILRILALHFGLQCFEWAWRSSSQYTSTCIYWTLLSC